MAIERHAIYFSAKAVPLRRALNQPIEQTRQSPLALCLQHRPVTAKRQPSNTTPPNHLMLHTTLEQAAQISSLGAAILHEIRDAVQNKSGLQSDIPHPEEHVHRAIERALARAFGCGLPCWWLVVRIIRMPGAEGEAFAVDPHAAVPVALWICLGSQADCWTVGCAVGECGSHFAWAWAVGGC